MALIKQNQETEQQSFKRNPVIDAQLNEFIHRNEKLANYIKAIPQEELERKYLLTKMNAEKQQQGYDKKVLEFINKPENAALKQIVFNGMPSIKDEMKHNQRFLRDTKNHIRNTGIKIS